MADLFGLLADLVERPEQIAFVCRGVDVQIKIELPGHITYRQALDLCQIDAAADERTQRIMQSTGLIL